MKTGDKVKVTDGSYTLSIVKGKLEHESGGQLMGRGVHTIIATECSLPAYSHLHNDHVYPEKNDTIIQSPQGILTFIAERFLNSIKKYCPECGKIL